MYKVIPIIHVLSKLGMLYAFVLMLPTLVSYLYRDGTFTVFAGTACVTFGRFSAHMVSNLEIRP